jgi:FkbM family methyltransferase
MQLSGIVLDVGGNFGGFALAASKRLGRRGQVFVLEPSADSQRRILEHISINSITNVTSEQAAVGAEAGEIELLLFAKSAYNSTISMNDGRGQDQAVGKQTVKKISIKSVLNQFEKVSLAKIDCEGAEYEIFDALTDDEVKKIEVFCIEHHKIPGRSHLEISDRLAKCGYRISGTNPILAVR